MIDLTGIVTAVISLLAAWITTQAIPWIKVRTTAEQLRVIKTLVRTAVYAAEQLFKEPGQGNEKKAFVKARLAAEAFRTDAADIDVMIEEAVLELNRKHNHNERKE